MFYRMGVNHVPLSERTVAPVFTTEDLDIARTFQEGRQNAIFQLCASTPSRNLSAEQASYLLARLAEAHPDLHWIVLSDDFTPTIYVAKVKRAQQRQRNISMLLTSNVRALWALIASSRVVVSPDSMSMHVAGVTRVPCVTYFGATDPALRICYYPTVRSVASGACPFAPCLHPGGGFPPFCPGRDRCTEIEGISTESIVDAVERSLQAGPALTTVGA